MGGHTTTSSPDSPQSSTHPHFSDSDLQQFNSAMEMLKASIHTNMADSQTKYFGEQLLCITMDHLHKVLTNVTSMLHQSGDENDAKKDGNNDTNMDGIDKEVGNVTDPEIRRGIYNVSLRITQHITELRQHVRRDVRRQSLTSTICTTPIHKSSRKHEESEVNTGQRKASVPLLSSTPKSSDSGEDVEDVGVRRKGQIDKRNLTERQKNKLKSWDALDEKVSRENQTLMTYVK